MMMLKDNIYYVGVINPNLRVFDIIMKTEYGTTYNAFLVKGEKTALIETVHRRYSKQMIDKIQELVPIDTIDYVIYNHTEPDHSGCIADLIKFNPDMEIIGSAAAIKNISNIGNVSFKSRVVKTGDKLDLGNGLELEFLMAPNLHWPDSMFTYLPARKTVFTCDFLGAHYCEPLLTDDEITYPEAYEGAFAYYYQAIFGPFKKFVLNGLDILEKLDFDMVCCSHGPVLKNSFKNAMEKYREWSTPKEIEKNVAIFYVSAYGYTKELADAFVKNFEEAGVKASAYDIIQNNMGELVEKFEQASGVLIGSPTINRDALKPVWDLLSSVDAITNRNKPFGVFGSYGWSGEACKMLEERCVGLGLKSTFEALRVQMRPSEDDLLKVKELSAAFLEKM